MDDERRDDDAAAPESTGPTSGRVRIIGAEPVGTGEPADSGSAAGGSTGSWSSADPDPLVGGSAPSWSDGLGLSGPAEAAGGSGSGSSSGGLDDDAADWASPPPEPELPHWTEAPTGEVPAVLARDTGESGDDRDPWAAMPGPTWREEHSDWEAHEDAFEPAMLASDDLTMSDRHDSLDEERQPWTFELSSSRAGSGSDADSGSLFSSDDPMPASSSEGSGSDVTPSATPAPDEPLDDDTVIVPSVGSLFSSSTGPDAEPSAPAHEGGTDDAANRVEGGAAGSSTGAEDSGPATEMFPAADTAAGAAVAAELEGPRRRLDSGGTPDATATPVVVDDEGADALQGDDPEVAGTSGILPPSLRNRFRRGRQRDAALDLDDVTPASTSARTAAAAGAGAGAGAASGTGAAAGAAAAAGVAAGAAAVTATPQPRPVPKAPPAPEAAEGDAGDALIVRRVPPVRPPVPPAVPGSGRKAGGADTGNAERGGRDLPIAVIAGIVLGLAVIITFKLGTVLAMLVVTAVVFVATIEALTAFRRAGRRPAVLLGWVATVSLMIATYNKGLVALPLLVVLTTALTMLWYMAGVERGADPLRGTADTLFVFCWIGVFGSYAALLLNPTLFPNRHGLAFLFGAIICTVAYDVAALGVGSWIGSRSLAPSISPGKTWEGAIGGGVAAVLAGVVIVHFIHPWTAGSAAVLGLVVAVVAPLGDLFESVVKRHLGLKDMGRILPGHGGILDRVDGLIFVLPATYYLVKAFHLG